jgi:tripartite-type tricarboxylate transporter receptor subunit TctC
MNPISRTRRALLGRSAAFTALKTLPPLAVLGGQKRARAQAAPVVQRVLCGAPPGSIPDIIARRFAERLSTQLGSAVVVENRAGAAGQIAIGALKQANPDGTTWLLAPAAVATVYPYLYSKLAYDPVTDLKPVSVAAEATLALAVGPAVPDNVRNIRELMEWSRNNPKLSNFGSPGAGTLPHLLSAMLSREAQLEWQHVAYAGGPPAIVDLLGGRIAVLVLPEGLLRPYHLAGKLRVLAHSGPSRSKFLPDIPSFLEQGFPNLVIREWFAFFMPGGSPVAAVEAASQAIGAAAGNNQVESALGEMGMVALASTPAVLAERIAVEQRYWQKFLSASGIRAE